MPELDDWRAALTRRAIQKAQAGRAVVIRGGPLIGKRFLARRIREALVGAEPMVTLSQHPGASSRPGDFEIPLIPLPRHHVLRSFDETVWRASAGHPHLIRGYLENTLDDYRRVLREALEPLRSLAPLAFAAWEQAREFQGTPRERYLTVSSSLEEPKRILDQASVLGLINRSMFGDAAGVVAVPLA